MVVPRQTKPRRSPARSKATPIEGLIRVGPLMSVPGILRAFGSEPELILGSVGLKPGHLEDPDTQIPYVAGSYCARPAFEPPRLFRKHVCLSQAAMADLRSEYASDCLAHRAGIGQT